MDRIGVAVIGIGGNMGRHKGEILRQMDDVNLCGVETDTIRRKEAKKELNIDVYEDIDQILKRKDIRAVTIDTPNAFHTDLTIKALEAGKYVLCEKPMATNLKDCQSMLDASKKYKGFLQIGFEMRYSVMYQRMKEVIEAGEAGKIANMFCIYTPGPYGYNYDTKWKKDPKFSGGLFAEKLCHYIDLQRWYLQEEMTEVVCFAGPHVVPDDNSIDNCHFMGRFKGGAVAELTFMFGRAAVPDDEKDESLYPDAGHRLDFTVVGDKGAVFGDVWGKWLVVTDNYRDGRYYPRVKRKELYKEISFERWQHNIIDEVKDFIWRIRNEKPPFAPPEDSYHTMKVCFAAEESAEKRQIIRLK